MKLSAGSQKTVDRILTERITFLTEMIRTGSTNSKNSAAIHLAMIGSRRSDQAIMDLIEELIEHDERTCIFLATTAILFSPNREDLREKIGLFLQDVDEEYGKLLEIDPRRLAASPFWQVVAEELENESDQKLDKVLNVLDEAMKE